jgi:Holliday junction resolvasome RuvABC endonuclease subunit
MILSIDQSLTETGVCYMSSNGRMETFIIKSSPNQGWGERLKSIADRLSSIFYLNTIKMENPSRIEYVLIEGYALAGSFRPFQLGELGGVIKYMFHMMGQTVFQIPIQQHKMFTARNGKATKQEMIAALESRFGIIEKNNNVADAISMALLFNAKLNKDSGLEVGRYDSVVIERMEKSIHGIALKPKPERKKRKKSTGVTDPGLDEFAF